MKNIIICCDGTDNEFGKNNTNVVKIYQMAQKGGGEQVAYYDPGVGTGGLHIGKSIGKICTGWSAAFGTGLQKNVEDAYRYLMRTYESGDRIFLLGFSRGAFTVRALSGMLHKCGLLYPDVFNMVEYVSKIYNTEGNDGLARDFKRTMARQCPVHFIGVWETVASLMFTAGQKFHNAKMNEEVAHGFHAVALDEMRSNFSPSLWEAQAGVEQVWFAGVHSDVGGWYVDAGLSDIALKWMAGKAAACGMLLDAARLNGTTGNPLAMQHRSDTGAWRVMGRHIRELPAGAKVHVSVRARLGEEVQVGDDEDVVKERVVYVPKATMNGQPLTKETAEVEWVE